MKLVDRDIDTEHRMGKFLFDVNRPIICKCVDKIIRKKVIKARRLLKGSAFVIREDLTLDNAKLLEAVSAKEEIENAWSDDCKILALLLNGKKVHLGVKIN